MRTPQPTRRHSADFDRQARDHLCALGPRWRLLIQHVGECRHQTHPQREPYEALMRAVAYQQLTTRAGDAMIDRLLRVYDASAKTFPSAEQIADSDRETLRKCGFSARKIDTLHGIAQGALQGIVPGRRQAEEMDDERLIAQLCTLKGIGRWTVEMFLIYTLERTDILPLDDLGIRQGLTYVHELDAIPSRKTLQTLGAPCRPYRTTAAWYLWRAPLMPDYARFKSALKGHPARR